MGRHKLRWGARKLTETQFKSSISTTTIDNDWQSWLTISTSSFFFPFVVVTRHKGRTANTRNDLHTIRFFRTGFPQKILKSRFYIVLVSLSPLSCRNIFNFLRNRFLLFKKVIYLFYFLSLIWTEIYRVSQKKLILYFSNSKPCIFWTSIIIMGVCYKLTHQKLL